jgi:hypothetical protein
MQRRQNLPRAAACNMESESFLCCQGWYDGQLPENRFHWEQVKHPIIRPALINDTGTAGQEPLCAKHLKFEQLDVLRQIQQNFAPGGSSSYSHSTDTNAQSLRLIPESMLVYKENKSRTRLYHTVLMLTRNSLLASGGRTNTSSWRFDHL